MDLEEVGEMDKQALGNWATDVFGECYSSKLPLAAMRVMAGVEKETGLHYNPRTTFYGEEKHQELAKMIFPWIEEVEKCCNLEEKHFSPWLPQLYFKLALGDFTRLCRNDWYE